MTASRPKIIFMPILGYILKELIDELLPHLCDLVNQFIFMGSVEAIKESIIVPLLKKIGIDAEFILNYTPAADLVFLTKLTERVFFKTPK